MGMSQGTDRDAGEGIKVGFSVRIREKDAVTPDEADISATVILK
jgi:hypothetical protein